MGRSAMSCFASGAWAKLRSGLPILRNTHLPFSYSLPSRICQSLYRALGFSSRNSSELTSMCEIVPINRKTRKIAGTKPVL